MKTFFQWEKLREFRLVLFTAFFVGIFADVFFFETTSDIRLVFLVLLWLLVLKAFQFKSDVTFKIVAGYLLILFLLFIFARTSSASERLSTWIYLFFIIGLIQQIREMRAQ